MKDVKVTLGICDGDKMEHVTSERSGTSSLNFFVNSHGLKLVLIVYFSINPLNAELNPICHLLALLGTHHIFHISVLRVNVNNNAINKVIIKQKCVPIQYVNRPS